MTSPTIRSYKLLAANSVESLEIEVRKAIAEAGWQPHGPPMGFAPGPTNRYIQAVVLYD